MKKEEAYIDFLTQKQVNFTQYEEIKSELTFEDIKKQV